MHVKTFGPVNQRSLEQLGTVGSGTHYVNLMADEDDRVWVGVRFGSRGFGHKTASGFLALAQGPQSFVGPVFRDTASTAVSAIV
jgi:tRNA-splicing ligase RtcB